ncbi:hypothetical protein CkaCkLH20_13109 [Colletotrichum karsti]|uniref:Uncharacterized protein n=1 Tax=Colletotrichum karsti TaxID=1095194 RepID=A0A9P6HTI4_9PEZI|nr:uncharacterized protein CkaCkLH20_13109 [Colletotrichum karsti]KAF9869392.1 hypothetical protein CkaCkLH20_13109 [Colletotrichum karsti]
MLFSKTLLYVAFTATVAAVALPPGFFHPPVHAFKDEANVEAVDAEPVIIEARNEAYIDTIVEDSETEPNIKARSEAATEAMDTETEPHIEAREEAAIDNVITEPVIETRNEITVDAVDVEPEIHARSEQTLDVVDAEPIIQARSEIPVEVVDAEPHIEARSEAIVDNVESEPVVEASEEPRIQARSEANVDWVDPNNHDIIAPITPADDWKYRDNLNKLKNNDCGIDCQKSLASYRSRSAKERRGNYDHYNNNKYDYSTVGRSSRASRGEHNTPADDWKYRDNLVKQDNHNCGTHCVDSLNSYRSVASKDSRLSRERQQNEYYNSHHTGNYDHPRTYDRHVTGNNPGSYDHHSTTYYPKDHHAAPITTYKDHSYDHPVTYDRHYNGKPSSRASRGEHNTRQDDINHGINHYKLDHHDCGSHCIDSIKSYHSVASADSKRSRASRESREKYGNYHGH